MRTHPDRAKSLWLKILPINPYKSKICMLSPVQLHCFHRPRGEGGTPCDGQLNPGFDTMKPTSAGEGARATSIRNFKQRILGGEGPRTPLFDAPTSLCYLL